MTGNPRVLADLPPEMVPVVGCQMVLREMEADWIRAGRRFVYWDRGYVNRGGYAGLRRQGPEMFRWHLGRYQMQGLNPSAAPAGPRLRAHLRPWAANLSSDRVLIAAPSEHYARFHGVADWTERAAMEARRRGLVPLVRQKTMRRPLADDLARVRCLVTHGSVAAVEAVLMGCPVVVDPVSAAAPVGRTDWDGMIDPVFPDRTAWLASIASCQFTAEEVRSGAMWSRIW